MSQTIAYPVDLHVHSRYSDGLFSPEELAALLAEALVPFLEEVQK